jgi:hypothetical protein
MSIAERPRLRPASGDEPHPSGDSRAASVTSGGLYGTSGAERRVFWTAFAVLAAFVLALDLVNILTVADDRSDLGRPIPLWEPAVWELTSGVSTLACVLLFYPVLLRPLRRAGGWPRVIAIHAVALVAASALHVGLMVLARNLIYRAVGQSYPLSLADFPYELRKDALAYAFTVGVFWLWRRHALREAPAPAPAEPAIFDIRDGAKILRTPVAEIRAATSAGNYVEFELADGRRPLMRATLAAIEAQLAPHGFLRTHRSWLVNLAAVRAIAPEGSGDFTLELDGGRTVPLSRRFPDALKALRG